MQPLQLITDRSEEVAREALDTGGIGTSGGSQKLALVASHQWHQGKKRFRCALYKTDVKAPGKRNWSYTPSKRQASS